MSLRLPLKLFAALVALVLLALVAVAFIGISIDAQRWRAPIAAALSRTLGREVQIAGPGRLRLSLRPNLLVEGIRIANPPGFDTPDFASIGELRLSMDLWPLLRGEIRIHELRGRDVSVQLTRSNDGRNNWSFDLRVNDTAAERGKPLRLDVHRVALESVLIEYITGGATHRFNLTGLTGEARAGQSTRLALRGVLDEQLTYTASATSAPLSSLGAAQPWPFDLEASLLSTVLKASGTLSGSLESPTMAAAFSASTQDVREIERLLQVKLPTLGAASLAGELNATPGTMGLKSIKAMVGTTAVSGDLALHSSGPRPKLTGQLAISELDLRPFLARAPGDEVKEPETLAEAYGELEKVDFDLKPLTWLDTDVLLQIARWTGVPGNVRDLTARLLIDAGKLTAPLEATIADARFEGIVSVDSTATPPRIGTNLVTREASLGGLAELLFDAPYVDGTVRRFEVTLDAAGDGVWPLARDLEGQIKFEGARFTYGNFEGGKPVEMRLDAAEVTQPRGNTISGRAHGALRGKAFDGMFRASTVEQVLRERHTPFGFDAASGSVRVRLAGTLAHPTDTAGPEVKVDVTAPHARELAPWLGFSSQSEALVAFNGTVRARRHYASLTGASLVVGRTAINGDIVSQGMAGKAIVKADLIADRVDTVELRAVMASPKAPKRTAVVEIPILPEELDLADSDVKVRVNRVDGIPLDITDVVFEGRFRGGVMTPSPFSLRLERTQLKGALALDARSNVPTSSLWLAGEDIDVGALLRRLRLAQGIEAHIGSVRLYAQIRERLLGQVLEHSSFVANVGPGALVFPDANTKEALRIALDEGTVHADAGGPISASVTGKAGTTPITLEMQGGRLRELLELDQRIPFSLTAKTTMAKLVVSGTAPRQRGQDVALLLALSGERLNGLDTLLDTSLPPWGPYALAAQLRATKRGYEVNTMRLKIGESVFDGKGSFETALKPPKLDVALTAERIQLDDFRLADWSPFERTAGPVEQTSIDRARSAAIGASKRVQSIFSRERLRRSDAKIEVVVKQVVSGKDQLGRGRFVATLANGRATLGPMEVESNAGSARGSLAYEPRERDVLVELNAKLDRFEYGVLARRIDPASDVAGAFSLDLNLDATAPRLSDALTTGSGRIDFTVWPRRLRARAFDLWATNLLYVLIPLVDRRSALVNCAVGQFDLADGRLQSVRLVIDTNSIRAEGSGSADFRSEQIRLRLVPRPKVPQVFSFAVPVHISGTFNDYRVNVRFADSLRMVAGWVPALVVVPIQRMVGQRVPADGRDVCGKPGR